MMTMAIGGRDYGENGKVLMMVVGLASAAVAGSVVTVKKMKVVGVKKNKFRLYYDTTNQWLMLKNAGKGVENYFSNNGYKTMAIYGMGELGNRLYEELRGSDKVEVKYAVDKKSGYLYEGDLRILLPDNELELVDVIVVTPVSDFEEVQKTLSEKINCPIISLEDVVFEL